jgi:hypothetical protein
MAYFTDPMAEEFRKALEDALKDSPELEDPDANKRASERGNSSKLAKKSARPSRSKRRKPRHRKKFSPKIAKSLR